MGYGTPATLKFLHLCHASGADNDDRAAVQLQFNVHDVPYRNGLQRAPQKTASPIKTQEEPPPSTGREL